MWLSRFAAGVLVWAGALLPAASARAQTGGAAALYASGDHALGEERWEEALSDCEAAVRLLAEAPTEQLGRAELCVARAAAALERFATAVEAASSAFRHLEESGATARRYRTDLRRAGEMVAELGPRVSRLVVEIEPAEARAGATVTVDGKPVDPALVGSPVPTDAGPFVVVVEARGFERGEVRGTLEVAAREEVSVRLRHVARRQTDGGPSAEERPLRILLGASLTGGAAILFQAELVVGASLGAGFDISESVFLGLAAAMSTEPENPSDLAFVVAGPALSARVAGMLWLGGSIGYGYSYWKDLDDRTPSPGDGDVEGLAATLEFLVEIRRLGSGAFTVGIASAAIFSDRLAFLVPLAIGYRSW